MKTPIAIISGYLGAGKTTLLKHIIKNLDRKFAILMNEFGEVGIDTQIIKGKDVNIAEITDGCVCCSLTGEFEAAIKEIIEKYDPEIIIIETTGVAEPDAIVLDISEELPQIRLDTVITVVDADAMIRFPSMSRIGQTQIEMADVLLLNKTDLIDKEKIPDIRKELEGLNSKAKIFETTNCEVDIDLLFGVEFEHHVTRKHHEKTTMQSFTHDVDKELDKEKFEAFLKALPGVYRMKGFVNLKGKSHLVNYVAGRWTLEEKEGKPQLVFIGEKLDKEKIIEMLQ